MPREMRIRETTKPSEVTRMLAANLPIVDAAGSDASMLYCPHCDVWVGCAHESADCYGARGRLIHHLPPSDKHAADCPAA